MSEAEQSFSGPTELTLEGLIDQREVKAVFLFKEPLSYREASLVRQAWEKGLEQGTKIGREWEEA